MNTIAIIQARTGSSRLPGKVLQDLAGQPMLSRVVNRVRRAASVHGVVVATTVENADNAIVALCEQSGWLVARGSQDDVLDRYYQTAVRFGADVVVRVTSDCPFIEPEIIDQAVELLLSDETLDYVSNTLAPRTFPRGLDVEAVRFEALARAWRDDDNPAWREHVTPYIYRHPERFSCRLITHPVDLSDWRWTVDTPEDLLFARKIYHHFGNDDFSWHDVLALLASHPEWREINRHVEQKQV